MLSPAIAALAAIGIVSFWNAYRRGGWRPWLLPVTLVGIATFQLIILGDDAIWADWLVAALLALTAIAVLGLLLPRGQSGRRDTIRRALATLGALALLIGPATWSGVTAANGTNNTLPIAGPQSNDVGPLFGGGGAATPPAGFTPRAGGGGSGGPGEIDQVDEGLVSYLEANQGDVRCLVAVRSAQGAAPIIIETGDAVMALGGFTGSDQILTEAELAAAVADGTVRYFLLDGMGPGSGSPGTVTDTTSQTPDQRTTPASANAGLAQNDPSAGSATGTAPTGTGSASADASPSGGGSDEGFAGVPTGDDRGGQSTQWVQRHCRVVPATAWGGTSDSTAASSSRFGGAATLYDCADAMD